MATFRTQLFKVMGSERPWTNVYHIDATDLSEASTSAGNFIASFEQSILNSSASIFKITTSSLVDDTFVTDNVSLPGGSATSSLLPLYNTMKININVEGFGRADYKFYRGILDESNTEDFLIDPTFASGASDLMDGLIADMIAAGTPLVDSDGNAWTVSATQSAIQMRQRHRRRKKAVAPPE